MLMLMMMDVDVDVDVDYDDIHKNIYMYGLTKLHRNVI